MVTGLKTQNNAETWVSGVTMPTVQCKAWGVGVELVQRDCFHGVSQHWSYCKAGRLVWLSHQT